VEAKETGSTHDSQDRASLARDLLNRFARGREVHNAPRGVAAANRAATSEGPAMYSKQKKPDAPYESLIYKEETLKAKKPSAALPRH
jgi:hypothetical protein